MKIGIIGEICEDVLMHNPKSVEVAGCKVWSEDITITAGGSVTYIAQVVQKLGEHVKVFSVVGDDECGNRVLKCLHDCNISDENIKVLCGMKTTKSIVVCDSGDKHFVGCSPMLPLYVPKYESFEDCDMLFVAGYALYPELWNDDFIELLKRCSEAGKKIVMDCQFLPVEDIDLLEIIKFEAIIKYCDIVLFAKKEVESLFGIHDENLIYAKLATNGFEGVLILKKGGDGSILFDGKDKFIIPQVKCDVYDSVGSGDIFGASFSYAYMNNWPLETCGRFASLYVSNSLGKYDQYKNYPELLNIKNIL